MSAQAVLLWLTLPAFPAPSQDQDGKVDRHYKRTWGDEKLGRSEEGHTLVVRTPEERRLLYDLRVDAWVKLQILFLALEKKMSLADVHALGYVGAHGAHGETHVKLLGRTLFNKRTRILQQSLIKERNKWNQEARVFEKSWTWYPWGIPVTLRVAMGARATANLDVNLETDALAVGARQRVGLFGDVALAAGVPEIVLWPIKIQAQAGIVGSLDLMQVTLDTTLQADLFDQARVQVTLQMAPVAVRIDAFARGSMHMWQPKVTSKVKIRWKRGRPRVSIVIRISWGWNRIAELKWNKTLFEKTVAAQTVVLLDKSFKLKPFPLRFGS